MGIKDGSFKKVVQKIETLEQSLVKSPIHPRRDDSRIAANYELYRSKALMHEEIRKLRKKIKKADNVRLGEGFFLKRNSKEW